MKHHTPVRWRVVPVFVVIIQTFTLALGVGAPVAHAGPGSRTLVNFDDLGANTPVYNQYDGVTFVGGDTSDHQIVIGVPAEGTASGTQALVASTTAICDHEFHCRDLHMVFDEPQTLVQLSVGSTVTGGGTAVRVTGLDASGAELTHSQADNFCSLSSPAPVKTPLTLADPGARIVAVDVTYVGCTGPSEGQPLFAVAGVPVEIDNLAFTLPLSPLPREHVPPIFKSTSPADGDSVTGGYPELIEWSLYVVVQEDALERLTVQINGGPEREMRFSRLDASDYSGGADLTSADGLVAGLNTLTLRAADFDTTTITTRIVHFTFTPRPAPPIADDIRLGGFEVTQVIDPGWQGMCCASPVTTGPWDGYNVDYHPTIPLLQGKQTLVRVYADFNDATKSVANVPAIISVRKAGCSSACDLEQDMPPDTFDPTLKTRIANLNGITVQNLTTVGLAKEEADLSKTWDFVIPAGYTNQDLDVTVRINDGHYSRYPETKSIPECTSDAGWYCQHNNLLVLHLHFQPTSTITVTVVLVRASGSYTCSDGGANNGKTLSPSDPTAPSQARVASDAQVNEVFRILNMFYPMHVNRGETRYLDFDISPSPFPLYSPRSALLNAVTDLAGDDDEFILGLLPVDPRCPNFYGPNENNGSSFTGGYGGVGHNGAWSNVPNLTLKSSDVSHVDAAHELGHNIGFDHWGCENGVGDDECGAFPIAHAGIGAFGTDIDNWYVLPPGDNSSNATPHAHDFMSYGQNCGSASDGGPGCDTGEWVSWYTYSILYGNTSIGDYDTDDPPALSITGTIAEDGKVTFEPVYQVDVNHPLTDLIHEDDAEQLYTLQGYDANGNVVLVHNFEPSLRETHTPNAGRSYYFREAVPVVSNLARIDLLRGSAVVGSLANPAPGQPPTVAITAPARGASWAGGGQQTIRWTSSSPAHVPLSALVQYSPDGGTTRLTLARNVRGTTLTINTDTLPGGAQGTIYVEVSDGMNIASAQTGPLNVAAKAPQVEIASPVPGLKYAAPMPVTFTAMAYDPQRGTPGLIYRWSADNGAYTFRETGAMLTLQNALPPGAHTVTVSVTNAAGLTTKASVAVTVLTPTGQEVARGSQLAQPLIWIIGIIAVLVLLAAALLIVLALRQRRRKAVGMAA